MKPISAQFQLPTHSLSGKLLPDQSMKAIRDVRTHTAREIKLREASLRLEASFLTHVVKAMEKTIPKSDLPGQGNTLPSMLFSGIMGEALAKANPTGLSQMFYQALAEKDHGTALVNNELEETALTTIHSLR